jgi:hypothetical protein
MTATPCGNSTVSFFESIKAGKVYLNVHSLKNPGVEVRGQLFAFPFEVPRYCNLCSRSSRRQNSPVPNLEGSR